MPPTTPLSPAQTSALAACAAVFLPADPPRESTVAFWHPHGGPPLPDSASAADPQADADPHGGTTLTVALPADGGSGGGGANDGGRSGTGDRGDDGASAGSGVELRSVPAFELPVAEAIPVLTRARASGTGTAAGFWGAAALLALQLAARGRLLPGLTDGDHDAWRLGPLDPGDAERVGALAGAMPADARAVPLPGDGPVLLPEADGLLYAFLDAVADGLPRTPAAALAAGRPAFASPVPQKVPQLRAWTSAVAAEHHSGVRLSLRIEQEAAAGDHEPADDVRFRAVLQVHSTARASLVTDAAALWRGDAPPGMGPETRTATLLALRRAAAAWEPLRALLTASVPDSVELADEEVGELLSPATAGRLDTAGVQVHWPRDLVRRLDVGADLDRDGTWDGQPGGGSGLLSPKSLLAFSWRFAVDGEEVSRAELDRLAEAGRALVRLRDRWILLDPEAVRRARARRDREVGAAEALRGALSGTWEEDGEQVEVRAAGRLAAVRDLLESGADGGGTVVEPPEGLDATLRDYQLRGLGWLDRLTSLGLGGCLADDMGLGKTVTLIALHLRRQHTPATAGPTLVVCPASLLGNWQREIERFAPGTPVRRYHGGARTLDAVADDGFVLTTYGTMRRDADALASAADWGLVVADEAQHVKNPYAATARRLRAVPGRARVALTGTPVENRLTELWAILDWTTPGLLGTLPAFRRRHADPVEAEQAAGGGPAAEQLARLVRPFLLRRRKVDPGIAPELPAKTETDHPVALTAEQAGLYEAVVREGLAAVSDADGPARRGLVVKLLTSLKQICNHPAQYLKESSPDLAGRSGKLELFDELLETLLAEGAGTLVFTQYVRMARLLEGHLAARGVPTMLLHGGTPVRAREQMVARFQAGEVPVFLLSLKAAGTGLNLTRAEHVVHFDRWWNPAVEAQATDRAHRIGQSRPVQVHRLVAEGTVEDRIARLLARKAALAEAVLDSGTAALTELTDGELAELVALHGPAAGEPAGQPTTARTGRSSR
ncbi:DEAD/DEAH box helicase [Streptomyces sp. 549]|uniref:DEAD/DEAH box helicase n=1 Tax=Streptomyces sp. 549 TaxID=3049076 RepID=UPI0024C2BBA9|nr:DEAD/DEAH box helicase [Streptomyces sp. 549]MDK1474646.1 DEAD/DEAH box helicase [Streptomyces sp. 549]